MYYKMDINLTILLICFMLVYFPSRNFVRWISCSLAFGKSPPCSHAITNLLNPLVPSNLHCYLWSSRIQSTTYNYVWKLIRSNPLKVSIDLLRSP